MNLRLYIYIFLIAPSLLTAETATDEWGNTLYPSQHGAPPGYPGCIPDVWEADGEKHKKGDPKYPMWGFPELQNYPGSVEHFRHKGQKYQPAVYTFRSHSLIRNWPLFQQPGLATEPYHEPIYYVPMYGNPLFTGRKRAAVDVFRLRRDGSNSVAIQLGKLTRGMYVVRTVGCIESHPQDWTGDPARIVLRCRLAEEGGATKSFIRRHRAVDEFYALGEWYLHVNETGSFRVTLDLLPETQTDVLLYNVDLHDALAGCPEQTVKTKATIYTAEARRAAQEHYAKHNKPSRKWGPNIQLPTAKGLWNESPLTPEERKIRDEMFWNHPAPEEANMMNLGSYGKYDSYVPSKEEIERIGKWELPFSNRYRRGWDKPRDFIVNHKLGLKYTWQDLIEHKPLPDPYPYKDRGWGVHVPGKGFYAPIMSAFPFDAQYKIAGHTEAGALPIEYFTRNNLLAARDAAFILCRTAYTMPAMITGPRRRLQAVTCRPAQCFGFNDIVTRRADWKYQTQQMVHYANVYDILFDFIKDNNELAVAVSRYVPWIKSPKDLRAFLDQRLLLLPQREMVNFNMGNDHGTTRMAIRLATIIDSPEAARPTMEYLFNRTWDYPLPLSGIQDYIVTGTTRDGTTSIGSFAYAVGGSPFLSVADMITTYIKNGGDRKYNLADPARFPKPFAGAYFNLDARVAGYWPLGVGDVGGVLRWGHWMDSQEEPVRIGWKYLRDPKLAWIVKHFLGRKTESDAEWAELEKDASRQRRNPWMENRSRVLSAWSGILESGVEHDDYRFKRAATIRVGGGHGHAHRDTLDLQVFAFGLQMSPDGGQRPGYGRPECGLSMNHNVVEVDGEGNREGDWAGHAWISSLSDIPGARVITARAIPPLNKPQVKFARRTVALIDVDEGKSATQYPSDLTLKPGTIYSRDVRLPKSYCVDFYRVSGGKRHTYNFHGCSDDEFSINATDTRKIPLPGTGKQSNDPEASYMRKYVLEGFQESGNVPADGTVVATWRLGREPYTFETKSGRTDEGKTKLFKCAAPERLMYGQNYDPLSPRKFTRLHLLNQQGARLLWGRWVSAPYTSNSGQWFTQLHAMNDGDTERDSVFTAVVETFAGDPFIKEATSVSIDDNEADALRASAIRVQLADGQRHFIFQDGRPAKTRRIPTNGAEISAAYAFVASDAAGLKQASLSGGRLLSVPNVVKLQPVLATYSATISAMDHLHRHISLDESFPEQLIGRSFWDVGNSHHRTSLEVTRVRSRRGKGSLLHFRKGLEIVSTRVKAVDEVNGVVTGKLVSMDMGSEEDNGMKPGMTKGLWVSDEAMSKWWQCEYLGGSRAKGFDYKLTGAPVAAADFPVNGTLRIWELGKSDNVRLSTWVSVRRTVGAANSFQLESNVEVSLSLPLESDTVEWSRDRLTWNAMKGVRTGGLLEIQFDTGMLGDGKVFLRASK